MYDLTGHLDENGEEVRIDPIHLVRRGIYDGWKDLELKVQAEGLALSRDGPALHGIITMNGRLLPHQLGACIKVLMGNGAGPGTGALLADEVGLGKTIEAGLVITELACRDRADRVLVLTPASLTSQWRDELRQIFGMDMKVADLEARREARKNGHSIWGTGKVISSINTAKQRSHMARIQALEWDVVVVDEAHKLKDRKTQNFRLVQGLRPKILLLLTATPIQNRLMELYNQVSLIDPRLLGSQDSFRNNFFGDRKGIKVRDPDELRKRLATVMIRNRRRDIPELDTVKRFGQTVSFPLSDVELHLYDEVTSFIRQEYLSAVERKQNARGYLMVLYQRMLTSSTKAIAGSLRKRMERVEDELSGGPTARRAQAQRDDVSNMMDLEYNERATELFNLDMDPDKRDRLKAELKELRRLTRLTDRIGSDTKAEQLRKIIRKIRADDDKALVFTEFRATQRFLADLLKKDGHEVTLFHGGLNPEEKDEAVKAFIGPANVMISTESGGEGRNLQFCHVLVNYDLPWNPMRIEQRIGRLHRIGQDRDVKIINFSTQGTIEEYVIDLLSRKIRLFEEVVGALDLILGDVSDKGNFEAMIMDILTRSSKKDLKDRFEEVGRRIEEVRKKNEEGQREGAGSVIQGLGLRTFLDPDEALKATMEEQARIMELVVAYLRSKGGKVWHDGKWCLEGTAPRSLMVATGLDTEFRLTFDRSFQKDPRARVVAHGQPLLDEIMRECRGRGFTALRRIPSAGKKGVASFHVLVTLKGVHEHKEMATVHIDLGSMAETIDPIHVLDSVAPDVDSGPDKDLDPMLASRVEAAYSTAHRTIETRSRELALGMTERNNALCDLSLERVNTYYNDLGDELARKEKVLEDEKYELVSKIRAGKEKRTRTKYREDLKKVNRRIEVLSKKNVRTRERHRSERLDEIKKIEARRAMRPVLELLTIGVSLPASGSGE